MAASRLIAIDPSLTCSGWALFSLKTKKLLGVGKIRSMPPALALAERLDDLQRKVCRVFDELALAADDILICESPTAVLDPGGAFKVERVRGIFEVVARERGIRVPGRINPRTVQREIMGLKGKQISRTQVKQTAVEVVYRLYGSELGKLGLVSNGSKELHRHQDIVDAVLVGSLGLVKIGAAQAAGVMLQELLEGGNMRRRVA